MHICYSIVEDHGPEGQGAWVVQEPDCMYVLVNEGLTADPHQMMRLVSVAVTRHVQREWLHVGDMTVVA